MISWLYIFHIMITIVLYILRLYSMIFHYCSKGDNSGWGHVRQCNTHSNFDKHSTVAVLYISYPMMEKLDCWQWWKAGRWIFPNLYLWSVLNLLHFILLPIYVCDFLDIDLLTLDIWWSSKLYNLTMFYL